MSIELADARWADGTGKGLLGQFASTRGYSDLIAAAKTPALRKFFKNGSTSDVKACMSELRALAINSPKDVASTAMALESLMRRAGKLAIITNGGN